MLGLKIELDRTKWYHRPLSPRRRGILTGVAALLVATTVAAAWMFLFLTTSVAVTSGNLPSIVLTDVILEAPIPAGCSVVWGGGNTASVSWAGAFPGDTCRLHATFHAVGAGTAFYRSPVTTVPGLILNAEPGPGITCGFAITAAIGSLDDYLDVSLDPVLSAPGTAYAGSVAYQVSATAPACP